MYKDGKILIGKSGDKELAILPDKANRHGLITGASGSGKTVTAKVMAESFSAMGVPVLIADVKGDLAGTCLPGEDSEKIQSRLNSLGIEGFQFKGFPTVFWDIFGKDGHPIRTKLQDVGPTILGRMLGLNETQEGVLSIIFKISKENGYDLIDTKDLRLLLQYVAENSKEYTVSYGNIAAQSVGTIQRSLLKLEEQGGINMFGEPAIDINDFLKTNSEGLGNINILHAVDLFKQPDLYASFLLWLFTSLSQQLPEVGDLEKPKLVFFFDEAHLLFNDLPSYMLENITQVVKLIRSKGVGLYFISQSPNDIPAEILAQLGNRVQHLLRSYTPQDQKVIKAVAQSYRANPEFDTEEAITQLGTGEALISFQTEKGEPSMVEKATILPPQSYMGTIDDGTRLMVLSRSEFKGKYDELIDNRSAFEILSEEMEAKQAEEERIKAEAEEKKRKEQEEKEAEKARKAEEKAKKEEEKKKKEEEKQKEKEKKNSVGYKVGKAAERTANSALSSIGRRIGNQIIKNLFK